MDYTKYELKSSEELSALLAGKDNLFLVACNKCFKEFDTVQEPELDQVAQLAASLGKTVTGTQQVDYSCVKMHPGPFENDMENRNLAAEIKKHVKTPVCSVGAYNFPEQMEDAPLSEPVDEDVEEEEDLEEPEDASDGYAKDPSEGPGRE